MHNFLYRSKKLLINIVTFTWLKRFIADIYEKYYNPGPKHIVPATSGWSIVVSTDGSNKEHLRNLTDSAIRELSGTPYEIILVGPSAIDLGYNKDIPLRVIPFKELGWVPGFITRKKNIGAKNARYDKIILTHDYIIFKEGWKRGFDEFGDDFTVANNVFLNKDGTRGKDWLTYDYPGIGRGSLPYHAETSRYQYMNGLYVIVKRDFFLKYPLKEKLRWGEAEDIEWSKRIRDFTIFKCNARSAITYSKQKPGDDEAWQEATRKLETLFQK